MTSKIASALVGLSMVLGSAGALTIATAQIAQARDMADCDGLYGRDYYNCKANRATAEMQDQRSGYKGDGVYRKKGPGKLYYKCKNAAKKFREAASGYSVDSATSADIDCNAD